MSDLKTCSYNFYCRGHKNHPTVPVTRTGLLQATNLLELSRVPPKETTIYKFFVRPIIEFIVSAII